MPVPVVAAGRREPDMPPRNMAGRAKDTFSNGSLDASAAQGLKIQAPAAQTLPSLGPRTPNWLPPQAGTETLGGPEISPPGIPYTDIQETRQWWAGDNAHDGLIFRDRHPFASRGTELGGRISCQPDPPRDGPIRPSTRLVNRTWNWQVGTGQAYADDLSRPYTWLGEQDGQGWTRVYGGQPGFHRWGPGGMPSIAEAYGPGRVPTGPAHGLHTLYPPDQQQTEARYLATAQQRPARVDRLSNSRIAGQSYSERTLHQGERPAFRRRRG